jgi:TPR repeat protein
MKSRFCKLTNVVILSFLGFTACAVTKMDDDAALTDELNYLRIEAMNTYSKACDANEAKSCSVIGSMYFKGDGVKQDFAKAAKPLEKACHQGEIRSCTLLGLLYERGDGLPQNISLAITTYQKACYSGDPLGCSSLAKLYEKGLNGLKAVNFYQKACEDGDNSACDALIRNYRFTDN